MYITLKLKKNSNRRHDIRNREEMFLKEEEPTRHAHVRATSAESIPPRSFSILILLIKPVRCSILTLLIKTVCCSIRSL